MSDGASPPRKRMRGEVAPLPADAPELGLYQVVDEQNNLRFGLPFIGLLAWLNAAGFM